MLKNFFFLIFKSIRHRPIRSWLTVLGVVIAVMVVSLILSLGSGIQNVVNNQLQMFGSNLIMVAPGKTSNPFSSVIGGLRFREDDIIDLERLEGVEIVGVHDMSIMTVAFGGEKETTLVHGVRWRRIAEIFEKSEGVRVQKGTYPASDDIPEAILGIKAQSELFDKKVGVGDEIVIKAKRFRVAGVFSEFGNKERDTSVFISLPLFSSLNGTHGTMHGMVKVKQGYDTAIVGKQIEQELSKQTAVRDFIVTTPENAAELAGSVLSAIELFLIFLAFISLLVGAVGIMNTMFTAILERTKQIGIMKAVGASSTSILLIFLIEAGLIGLIGGFVGILLGILLAYLASFGFAAAGIEGMFSLAGLDYLGFATVMIVTFITGLVSGILPARKAAKLQPAEALRFD